MRAALSLSDPADAFAEAINDLPRAVVLNSFRLRCPGAHHVTRLPRPESREARKALEQELRVSLFGGQKGAYAAGELDAPGSHVVELLCDAEPGLHAFDLRAAIAEQARAQGFDAAIGFGGEIHVVGLPGEQLVGPILVQRRLRLRVVEEGWDEPETRLVARHGTRWLVAGTLADADADADVRRNAVGESADRLAGAGPRRGEVVGFAGDAVTLRHHGRHENLRAADYALTASSAFVRRHHGATTLRGLQVASGSLTRSGQRNQHAVKERFEAVGDDLAAIGLVIDMPGGRQATIEPDWVEVRIQESA